MRTTRRLLTTLALAVAAVPFAAGPVWASPFDGMDFEFEFAEPVIPPLVELPGYDICDVFPEACADPLPGDGSVDFPEIDPGPIVDLDWCLLLPELCAGPGESDPGEGDPVVPPELGEPPIDPCLLLPGGCPEVPETPETPEVPDTPETPETPETPDTPDTPETPDTTPVDEHGSPDPTMPTTPTTDTHDDGGSLPFTGGNSLVLAGVAFAALAGGAGLLFAARRARKPEHS